MSLDLDLDHSHPHPQPPYPLHESVVNKLDPQYVSFYNKHLINTQQVHLQPVSASRSAGGKIILGGSNNLAVGKTQDFSIARQQSTGPEEVKIRCFTPTGDAPADGWPVMVYYHGGGWVLGTIDTENAVCTNMCVRTRCVVVNTDYRLAPENPYPTAVHDAWEALLWTVTKGVEILNLNVSKLAIGGSSAGGNLAAVMTQKALALRSPPSSPTGLKQDINIDITFVKQLLIVPVTDNTATISTNPTYKSYEFTPALPPAKMLWYRHHYLPDPTTWTDTDASPLLFLQQSSPAAATQFPERLLQQHLPPTVILVGELDILRHEGEEYARLLNEVARVPAKVEVMKGMPHPFLAMDAVLDQGRRAVSILCRELSEAFYSSA